MRTTRIPATLWSSLRRSVAAMGRAQATNLRQGMSALLVASAANLLAGITLGLATGTLDRLPGLIVLVPAAIAVRGNIFGAVASRLGTSVHTGEWSGEWERRPRLDSVVGQNVTASAVLTLYVSIGVALLAREVSRLLGLQTISLLDFLVISVVGGVLASVVVLAITLAVAVLSVRRGWDIDNVAAPVVTSTADLVTVPTLLLATFLLPLPVLPEAIAVVTLVAAGLAVLHDARHRRLRTHIRIVRQSLPILLLAGLVDVMAGITIHRRMDSFLVVPALLVLIPPLLADAGALGGILSARLSSKLHLGSIEPAALPGRRSGEDIALTYLLAVPIFVVVGLGVALGSELGGLEHPGLLKMVAVALLAGTMATSGAVFVAYYTAVLSYRFGLDPDSYGIPAVTASMDLIGVLALVISLVILGVVA